MTVVLLLLLTLASPESLCAFTLSRDAVGRRRTLVFHPMTASTTSEAGESSTSPKHKLLDYLNSLNKIDRLPCGLECTDKERISIEELITDVITNDGPSNDNRIPFNGVVNDKDLLGEWDLLYTSSRTMRINKSLSGLGRSESDMANVVSIRKKYSGSK